MKKRKWKQEDIIFVHFPCTQSVMGVPGCEQNILFIHPCMASESIQHGKIIFKYIYA